MSKQLDLAACILFEDPHILVINKPSSLMVEPDRNGHPNLLQQVRKYVKASTQDGVEAYAQHIHRLDRPVSGIVLFAKQRTVLRNLSEQFAERKVKKFYQALTAHPPQVLTGRLEHWHRKEKKKALIFDEAQPNTEKVLLDYEAVPFSEGRFLWNIKLHTGKFHQIRAQLAALNCPIIGDSTYGSLVSYQPDSIALHASMLIFQHPVTCEEITVGKDIFIK